MLVVKIGCYDNVPVCLQVCNSMPSVADKAQFHDHSQCRHGTDMAPHKVRSAQAYLHVHGVL